MERDQTTMPRIRTILVVDDEPGVRLSLRSILQERFTVIACADGPAAIKYAAEHPGEVYAAFVDHGLPHMDGNRVCSALRLLDGTISLVGFTGNEAAVFVGPLFAKLLKRHISPTHVLTLAATAVQSAARTRHE